MQRFHDALFAAIHRARQARWGLTVPQLNQVVVVANSIGSSGGHTKQKLIHYRQHRPLTHVRVIAFKPKFNFH